MIYDAPSRRAAGPAGGTGEREAGTPGPGPTPPCEARTPPPGRRRRRARDHTHSESLALPKRGPLPCGSADRFRPGPANRGRHPSRGELGSPQQQVPPPGGPHHADSDPPSDDDGSVFANCSHRYIP